MPSLPFSYSDFHGGLNTYESLDLLQDNQARSVWNVQSTTAGAIVKRGGFKTFATGSIMFTSLFALESVSPSVLVAADSSGLYSVSSSGTVTSIKTGLSNNPWSFVSAPAVSAQGQLYGMNGTDTPQQWNGSAASTSAWTATDTGGTVPNGKYCVYSNNQVFVSGVSANPSRVYWSAIADPTGWNPANLKGAGYMDFDPNDGGAITGIGSVGPYLLVGKARKLWVLIDPSTATARRLSDSIGIASHRSIAEAPQGTYFLSEDRVYLTNGSKLEGLSDTIQPTVDKISPRSTAAGVYFNQHYYLSCDLEDTSVNPSGGSPNVILDYDTRLQSWWRHSVGVNQFAIWHVSGTPTLYSATCKYFSPSGAPVTLWNSTTIDQCFVSGDPNDLSTGTWTDGGHTVYWEWVGPWQSPSFYRRRRFPTPYFRKRVRQIRYEGVGFVDMSLTIDFGSWITFSNIFGSVIGTTQDGRVYGQGVGRRFSLRFSGTYAQPATVFMYVLMLTDRRDLVAA